MDKQELKENLLKAKDADAAFVARNTPILISFLTEPGIIFRWAGGTAER